MNLICKRKTEFAFAGKFLALPVLEQRNDCTGVPLFFSVHQQFDVALQSPMAGVARVVLGINDLYQLARSIDWVGARLNVLGHIDIKGPVERGTFLTCLENGDDFPASDAGEKLF
ncbi:hypothetical protein [Pseudomonas sp. PDM31]|uniref:hypothetical protein n=1 Tax=Pseudomonas sp. PDM31 TaxID=2854778 RepID=UPI001C47409E|nr:hypothetical protein [Pseudomonas sp. PDM31]MBV7479117.1 hypothetical protein [Pseudomonas sp. PDM31]